MVTVVSLLAMLGSEVLERKASLMLLNMVFVIGLFVFIGNSGVLSFGHAAFMGLGAYTYAFMTANPQLKKTTLPDAPAFLRDANIDTWQAVGLSALVPAVFALIVALPLMRLNGLAAGIATLAMLFAVGVLIANWESLTGGRTSFAAIRTATDVPYALVIVLIMMVIAFIYQQSRFGLRLRGTREDQLAARSLGISVVRERTIAWVLSAAIVGISGAMLAGFIGTINPEQFFLGARGSGGVTLHHDRDARRGRRHKPQRRGRRRDLYLGRLGGSPGGREGDRGRQSHEYRACHASVARADPQAEGHYGRPRDLLALQA